MAPARASWVVPGSVQALAFCVLVLAQTSVALLFSLGQRDGKYAYHPLSAQASAEACFPYRVRRSRCTTAHRAAS
jgi:hypothetical protein